MSADGFRVRLDLGADGTSEEPPRTSDDVVAEERAVGSSEATPAAGVAEVDRTRPRAGAPPHVAALRPVDARHRTPGPDALARAQQILQAAGLVAAPERTVTVTTEEGRWLVVGDGGVVVGREPSTVDLVVDAPTVSRRHCRVRVHEDRVEVEDLRTSNGTWVQRGTERIDVPTGGSAELQHGDWVRAGANALLVYVGIEEATA